MSANTFGYMFRFTTFGESHGPGLGVVIDGVPAGVVWNKDLLEQSLRRRRPGQNAFVTSRNEQDRAELLSGVFEGKTLGSPIAMIVKNQDTNSEAYDAIKDQPRPGHADDVWSVKFGHRDHRGGGRASGRETLCRVMAGAVAEMFLSQTMPSLKVAAFAKSTAGMTLDENDLKKIESSFVNTGSVRKHIDGYELRFAGAEHESLKALIAAAKTEGKSYGGVVELWIDGVNPGLGQPVFAKLKSDLAKAMMSIGATIGVEFGEGFFATSREGSEFHRSGEEVYGGIRGGISTGERIVLRVAFKPTATVLHEAQKGRHDPCIVPRAIPVVEAMAFAVLADHALWASCDRV